MIVYGASLSPFVRKVLVFAAEKGLTVENQPVNPMEPPTEFVEASPFRKIPALRDGDFTLADSSAIIHYMDAVKPDPELIPIEAKARARTIWFEEFADTMITSVGGKILFNRFIAPRLLGREGDLAAADKAEQEELPPLLDYLESQIPSSGFLVADRLTLADIAVASPLATLNHIGVRTDAARFPKLAGYCEALVARPSFADLIANEVKIFGIAG